MLKVYGFSRVNKIAYGNTRDVADILMTHVLSAGSTDQALLKPYQHVRTYLARCMDRPAWKRTLDAYCARVEPG